MEVVSLKEASEILEMHEETVKRLSRKGVLPKKISFTFYPADEIREHARLIKEKSENTINQTEVAKLLGCSEGQVNKLRVNRRMPQPEVEGREILWDKNVINEWLLTKPDIKVRKVLKHIKDVIPKYKRNQTVTTIRGEHYKITNLIGFRYKDVVYEVEKVGKKSGIKSELYENQIWGLK